jgi:hypothetical protein
MSVDILNAHGKHGNLPGEKLPGPITDLVILFGGWGNLHAGDALTDKIHSSTTRLAADVRRLPARPHHRRLVLALQGSMTNLGTSGVGQGLEFIRQHFHPWGKIIVYGFSVGGTDALSLCRAIQSDIPYYNFTRRKLVNSFAMEDHLSRHLMGTVRVDLLITIDAATGPVTGLLTPLGRRRVPACVRRNINYYQTKASTIGSHGGPNVAVDPAVTRIDPAQFLPSSDSSNLPGRDGANLTGQAPHGLMGNLTNQRVLKEIRRLLEN